MFGLFMAYSVLAERRANRRRARAGDEAATAQIR
jgi:hypothetical protein